MTRYLLLLVAALTPLAACGDDATAAADAGMVIDAAPDAATCTLVPRCAVIIDVPAGEATTMELRGDFAPDGWTTGIAMTRAGDRFTASVPDRLHGRTFQYKLLVDGVSWLPDPENPRVVDDGAGGENSVALATCDACPRAVFDWRDAVIYFVLLDRFRNGDPTNDDPLGIESPGDWHGGDLAGLLDAIESGMFEDLGVNTLWISSPLANATGAEPDSDGHEYSAYHGYWPIDPEAIDPRLGDRALLQAVVDAAHARGLRVVVDYVMNHVHLESALVAEHPDWFWPGEGCVCGQGCSFDDLPDRERCWFRSYLPDFNFQVAAARYYSVSNAVRWARDLGLDGFRLDAIKHVEREWTTDLRQRLVTEVAASGQPFYLVGETFSGDRELIKSYVGKTMLDGQFDFPLRAAIVTDLLAPGGSLANLMAFMDGNDTFYGPAAIMSTFIGNHDLPRVVHLAEDPPLFGPWDSGLDRAWQNQPTAPSDPAVYERLLLAYALILTTPGAPLIYYGDEVGLPGGGDPDNRRDFPEGGFTAEQLGLRAQIAALAKLRAATPAMRVGRRVTRGATASTAVYALVDGPTKIYVALNRGDEAAPAPGLEAGTYDDLLGSGELATPISIPPRSVLVLAPRPL